MAKRKKKPNSTIKKQGSAVTKVLKLDNVLTESGTQTNSITDNSTIQYYDNLLDLHYSNSNIRGLSTLSLDDHSILDSTISDIGSSLWRKVELEQEIGTIKKKFAETFDKLQKEKQDKKKLINELQSLQNELKAKENLTHIIPRIREEAVSKIFSSDDFKQKFQNSNKYDTAVLSIDIRKSTELMLKARSPQLFADFITNLSQKLSSVIIKNYGIFDKFTGDGILAFFPDFYSGEDAICHALNAASECHEVFKAEYSKARNSFNIFIKEVGLGIGIDYGNVTLVNTNSELTIVGIPVVYACRMSGAPAGVTLFNQPAKEHIESKFAKFLTINECEIFIKNEGTAIAYTMELNTKAFTIKLPDWTK